MLKKMTDWEKIEGIEFGDYEALELGGHEVVIKNAYPHTNPQTGNETLKVEVDIAGDDKQAGYFQKQYDNNPNADKKWSNNACKYFSLKDEENPKRIFKGFITALGNSNDNFDSEKWDWEEKNLIGLKICGVFGLEEYEYNDKTGFSIKLQDFRSLNKLNEVKIPHVRFLDGSKLSYEEYQELKTLRQNNKQVDTKKEDKIDQIIDDNMLD